MISYEQYLRESAVPTAVIDVFLAQSQPTWARFDPEVGYLLGRRSGDRQIEVREQAWRPAVAGRRAEARTTNRGPAPAFVVRPLARLSLLAKYFSDCPRETAVSVV
jgi:hypothetical protein